MTTLVGYSNHNGQKILRPLGHSGSNPSQDFVLECLHCFAEYLGSGSDIHIRKCPRCQGGQPAEPVR